MARVNILITSAGAYVNESQANLINYSALNETAGSSQFFNQVTLAFYSGITATASGIFIPDRSTVVKTGLTGTVEFAVWSSADSPYPVAITENTINIASACILQWTGITEQLDVTCTDVSGASYINILLDRT